MFGRIGDKLVYLALWGILFTAVAIIVTLVMMAVSSAQQTDYWRKTLDKRIGAFELESVAVSVQGGCAKEPLDDAYRATAIYTDGKTTDMFVICYGGGQKTKIFVTRTRNPEQIL